MRSPGTRLEFNEGKGDTVREFTTIRLVYKIESIDGFIESMSKGTNASTDTGTLQLIDMLRAYRSAGYGTIIF